jgi:hypothetical protein
VGGFPLAGALHWVNIRSHGTPDGVVLAAGLIFFVPGVIIGITGLVGAMQRRARRRLRQEHPDQPWLGDHTWDSTGATDDSWRKIVQPLAFKGFLAIFAIPFNWVGFGPPHVIPFGVAAVVMDLIAALMLIDTLRKVLRLCIYGTTRLTFEQFPYFLGKPLEATLLPGRNLSRFKSVVFTLRCVEEVTEVTGTGKDQSTQVVRYQVYGDEFVIGESSALDATTAGVPVTFLLPDDAPATDFAATPPRYWEIEVKAKSGGELELATGKFDATYLVPVYAGPASVNQNAARSGV